MTNAVQMAEADRLKVLQECRILDTPAEPFFDEIALLAATATASPVALLTFFDAEREWVKARYRWNIAHVPRDASIAATMLESGSELMVADTQIDERFSASPLVTADPKIRFCAGVPILSSEGALIGAIAVYDRAPRVLSEIQLQFLRIYASQAGAHVNLRRRLQEANERASHYDETRTALRESDDRFRELFDNVDDLIMTFGRDGKLLHVNSAAALALGGDSGSLADSVFDLVHPEARTHFRQTLDGVVKSGTAERLETTLMRASGGRLVVDGTLLPKVVDGFVVLVRVIFRDVTDRKQIEVELSHARDAALESARLKTQFLTNMSHEIRTPIHALTGMLGLLLETQLNGEQRDFATTARASGDALLAIINNILHVSRLEAGKLTVSVADFDVITTVERVMEVMQIAAHEKGLAMSVEFDPALPAVVRGDPGRYRQVLVNLLTNAVKFTDRGKITVRVGVERETSTHTLVRLAVNDSGMGIPEGARERIFESFHQLDGSSTREHGGMGLGLSIAKQLVELMGGVIGCDSVQGQGSTFWYTIPFEKRVTERLAVEGTKLAFPGARVLIVDQSDTNRKLVQHYVGSWGMRSRTAESEAEALERLRAEAAIGDPYQAVIFDFQLRPNGGLHLARLIKSDPSIAETGLVMQTYLGDQLDDGAIRASGVSAYLAKPVDKSELFDCLTAALAKETLHRDISEVKPQPENAARIVTPVPKDAREQLKILLAEDKPLNQKLTLSQLRSLGYSADAVSNGNEVIDALAKKHYDIILMDCQMPLMDGYETTMEIRRQESNGRHTKIIAMTANAMEGDREKCLAAGMDDYLSKPTRREDLDAALARAYSRF